MGKILDFTVDQLFERQFFSALDTYFARTIADIYDEKDPIVVMSLALVSRFLSKGYICVDIQKEAKTTMSISSKSDDTLTLPDAASWKKALLKSEIVSDRITTPLVLDEDSRLYLAKYFDFQNRLVENIAQRLSSPPGKIDDNLISPLLATCFPDTGPQYARQKAAVKNAVLSNFTIISGGPGTGKTHIVSIIKELFISCMAAGKPEIPKIICVAPTGKAAAKMENGSTIHKILKPLKDTPGFHYNKTNLLPADMVIIDEASMIDITLMTRLLEAIPMTARIIILGDQHQLSSVQAGSVFRELCSASGLSEYTFFLEYNFRSKGKTGIENLSRAIHQNNVTDVEQILTLGEFPDLVYEPITQSEELHALIEKYAVSGFSPFLTADTTQSSLDELDRFRILCAHNTGEFGTLQINHVCKKILQYSDNSGIQQKSLKQIVMVNTNNYQKGLFNGDTGIWQTDVTENQFVFRTADDSIRQFHYLDNKQIDTAFAITIHKSQGSEFRSVLIVLPDRLSPVMTRQLLYTGVTRAKEKVIIIGNMQIIQQAVSLAVPQHSGLARWLNRRLAL